MKNIAIVSIENDFHAEVIRHELKKYSDADCPIIEADKISNRYLNWSLNDLPNITSYAIDDKERKIPIESLHVIWWRRTQAPQQISQKIQEKIYQEYINRNCNAYLLGSLYSQFVGKWISNPIATNTASNKIIQLQAAKKAGFIIPETIVSEDPDTIRNFSSLFPEGIVVKALHPSIRDLVLTHKLTESHLSNKDSLMLCPNIYQEYIPGSKHLRINCFGRDIYPVMLESTDLDWRLDLTVPMNIIEIEENIKECIYKICEFLHLEMGIFDLKINSKGDTIWLEVNPQGQFLFLEGITGINLKSAFAKFLYEQSGN